MRSLAFACALLVLWGGLAELAVREAARRHDDLDERMLRYDPLSALVEPHGEFGFKQKPNTFFRYPDGKGAWSNAQGFRGPEVQVPKPPDRQRVLILGGSATHGWGANDDETIDAYMREILVARGRTDVDVVNLAMDGYDSWQILERLRTEGPRHRPDVVIVSAGIVDVGHGRFANLVPADPRTLGWEGSIARFRNGDDPSWGDRVKHASRLLQFVLLKQHEWAASPPVGRVLRIDVDVQPDAVRYFGENLRRIIEVAEELDAPVLLVTPPSGMQVMHQAEDFRPYGFWLGSAVETERYRIAMAQQMKNVARDELRRGRSVKYLAPTVDDEFFLDDAHLRPEGNLALAGQLVRAIQPWLAEADDSSGDEAPR